MRVLAIPGSLRNDSHNAKLLYSAAKLFPEDTVLDLWGGLKSVPPYDEDDDGVDAPEVVAELREAIARADAVLIATPEYNHSIPGQLKNAFDWVSRPVATNPMRNKPVAVIGASTGAFGGVWAQAELRKVMGALGARVLDVELALPHAHENFDEQGRLIGAGYAQQLLEVVDAIVAAVEGRRAAIAEQVAV
jgi:chromate reductase, NAD(P)H dehydrogenase (quinone)